MKLQNSNNLQKGVKKFPVFRLFFMKTDLLWILEKS